MRSNISSQVVFASCVWCFHRAYYGFTIPRERNEEVYRHVMVSSIYPSVPSITYLNGINLFHLLYNNSPSEGSNSGITTYSPFYFTICAFVSQYCASSKRKYYSLDWCWPRSRLNTRLPVNTYTFCEGQEATKKKEKRAKQYFNLS